MDLSGKIALVTGASRARQPQWLWPRRRACPDTGRDAKALEGVEQAIHEAGGTATIAPMDLLKVTRLPVWPMRSPDVGASWTLVINAGILPTLMPVVDIDQKALNKAVSTHLLATQALLSSSTACCAKAKQAA
jgi:NAD(P)-dependent dehydrogenase (short-subunit alcohol dehydrogenase family)